MPAPQDGVSALGRARRCCSRRRAGSSAGGPAASEAEGSACRRRSSPSTSSRTGLPLSDVTWTGERFLYATETEGTFSASGPTGSPVTPFATIPSEIEEVRCQPSPGTRGWPAGMVFCHAPHGVVYRLAPDGSTSAFATLPETDKQDGVMVFDTAGLYGYAMLVTTGGPAGDGGTVYALDPDASRRLVGTFPGPGGADNLELAPGRVRQRVEPAPDRDRLRPRARQPARAACWR